LYTLITDKHNGMDTFKDPCIHLLEEDGKISWTDHVRNEEVLESRRIGIPYVIYVNGRRTGLVTFCVETFFYNGLLKERYKGG